MDSIKLADLLFPDITTSLKGILEKYPKRQLPDNAMVTRFAPSPTGFLHIGGLFAAFISERLAHQSAGVFYLRIEDTDKKREIKDSIPKIIEDLNSFNIHFDEGQLQPDQEIGNYAPYKQSEREYIYKTFIKELVKKGLAYPCFCNNEDLVKTKAKQKSVKQPTGYYGKWAICRHITLEMVEKKLADEKLFAIRLKSPGKLSCRITFKDIVKGEICLPESVQDIVLLKSDGLPTYHFAHVIDDYLMGTTHVFRGDEWLSSVPIHLQLFSVLKWNPPCFGHISPIMKMDGTSKRKFSKRKDPESVASWYCQQGYPPSAVLEFLLGLANSNFEEWRHKNPHSKYSNFKFTVEKMGRSGSLFDLNKLNDVCKNVISNMSNREVYMSLVEWTLKYDLDFHNLIVKHKDYTLRILNIGRSSVQPRKDFTKWSDIKPAIIYFYDEFFCNMLIKHELPASISIADLKTLVKEYLKIHMEDDSKKVWFEKIKDLGEKLGYARSTKSFRNNPSGFKGSISDVTMVLRIALSSRSNTPDLYTIMQVMGKNRVLKRLRHFSQVVGSLTMSDRV